MLLKTSANRILFLDIETVPVAEHFSELSPKMQKLWEKKTHFKRKNEYTPEEYYGLQAGVYSEFAKIICVSCGIIYKGNQFRIKSFYGNDEKEILETFAQLLNNQERQYRILCAHNGKEFDFPFLARRMVVHQIPLPRILQLAGKKPWEVPHLDTLELWKFGDRKNYTSIDLLCSILNIPTPKTNMEGNQVATVYYDQNDLDRIVAYCEKDVFAVAQIFRKFRNEPFLELALT